MKYEIPKPVSEIGIAYVSMKDFKFDPEQQQVEVVWSYLKYDFVPNESYLNTSQTLHNLILL